tara:strand:+ start:26 stop:388 length:363 start_codon:yes stop_codon:yes gene_type:complete
MLGQQMLLSGTTETEMEEGIIQEEQQQMFVRMCQELLRDLLPVVTVGVVTILTVMAGLTKEINSLTNQHNGKIWMVMDLVIIQKGMKETRVQMSGDSRSSIASVAVTQMAMVGQTPPRIG